ncbi:MAG: ribulose 1,5-bisphosphate carboxylase [Actinobacteria bacterium]|nr:ribulose 1,5-bisphosphate carboxylase [Actinomycetota bacterium]
MSDTERLSVVYELRLPADLAPTAAEDAARAVAVEQSVEMPVEAIRDRHVRDHVVGRLEDLTPLGVDGATRRWSAVISLATSTVGEDPVQLLNMLAGNVSLHDHVRLTDLTLPSSLLARFDGPARGLDGLRSLVGIDPVAPRALTCTAIKPQGLAVEDLAAIGEAFALGGVDIVKDDHGIADPDLDTFTVRVRACQDAVERANRVTGGTTRYAPNLIGPPDVLRRKAEIALELGVRVVLVAPMLVGVGAFVDLVRSTLAPARAATIGHPAAGGTTAVAPEVLLGSLFRLFGADAVIFPNHGGRFSFTRDRCATIAAAARRPWGEMRPALPTPAGGITPDRVEELVAFYGRDVMLLVGGALLLAGDALTASTADFVSRVHAVRW